MKKTAEEIRERIVQAHIESINWDEGNFDLLRKNIDEGLEEYRSQASELPSDDEIESLSVKRYRGEDLDEQKRNSKLILAFEDGLKQMRSIASPILASHVARIKELEEEIKQLKLADKVKCDCDENTCCYYCEFEKAGTRNLTMPKD